MTTTERTEPALEAGSNAPSQRPKRAMSLELFGQRFTVVSDNDEAHVRDLVDYVNRKLEDVRDSSRRIQVDQIALLALLNVAEELFREKQQSQVLRRRVRERSRKLLGAIDTIAHELDVSEAVPLSHEGRRAEPASEVSPSLGTGLGG